MSARSRSSERQFVRGGATTMILAVLAEQPLHGYELIQTIRRRSDGIFAFSDGTVYPLLYSLRDKGWLRSEVQTPDAGRSRKVYHLTTEGRVALNELLENWDLFARGMKLALGRAH